MGILRSFNIGVSGLSANGQGMGVVADNIANAGTNGFKSSRAEFQDVLATSLKGIDGGDQFGAGTRLAHIRSLMTQGDINRTDSVTDMAVNGDGFFKLKTSFGPAYTRDGSLHFNKDGELVNGDGYQVLGFPAGNDGKITNVQEPIKLSQNTINAEATKEVEMSANLDSRADVLQFNAEDPDNTSNYSHSVTVYDNVGTARLVTLYYNKTADNNWTYRALVDGKDAAGGVEGKFTEMASGTLAFNDKGQLQQVTEGASAFNFNKGAAPGQAIKFSWGKSIADGGKGDEGSTQFGSRSDIGRATADGHSAATLASLSFNDDGVLTAVYDNGENKDIAQIAVAKFENNEGLFKLGKNLYKESRKSGQPVVGSPGEGGRGQVLSKSLELSNVDIANEFVGLITQQRNFSANAKTLQTADEMLKDVLSIKR